MHSDKSELAKVEIKVDPGTIVIVRSRAKRKDNKLLPEAQTEADVWAGPVSVYISQKKMVSILEIAAECLRLPAATLNRAQQLRIARILKSFGWWRKMVRLNAFKTGRRWFPPEADSILLTQ